MKVVFYNLRRFVPVDCLAGKFARVMPATRVREIIGRFPAVFQAYLCYWSGVCTTKGGSRSTEPEKGGSDVVLITSNRLGVGDERLGEILMKAFLNTLWDLELNQPSCYLLITVSG